MTNITLFRFLPWLLNHFVSASDERVCGQRKPSGFQQFRRLFSSPKLNQKEKQNVEETDENDTGGHGTHGVFRWRSKRPLHQGVQPSARPAQGEQRSRLHQGRSTEWRLPVEKLGYYYCQRQVLDDTRILSFASCVTDTRKRGQHCTVPFLLWCAN